MAVYPQKHLPRGGCGDNFPASNGEQTSKSFLGRGQKAIPSMLTSALIRLLSFFPEIGKKKLFDFFFKSEPEDLEAQLIPLLQLGLEPRLGGEMPAKMVGRPSLRAFDIKYVRVLLSMEQS